MNIIGVDPGLDGAIAILNAEGHMVGVKDMPTLEVAYKNKTRRIASEPQPKGKARSHDCALCLIRFVCGFSTANVTGALDQRPEVPQM